MKSAKIMLNIMSVICFIFGAVYSFSIILLPIGIYCFIAAKRFSYRAEHLIDVYMVPNKVFKGYAIFVCFACFPFGFIALISYRLISSNNVTVDEVKNEAGLHLEKEEEKQEVKPVYAETELTEKEKQEKFEKLQNFKEKGIITEEELEMAREQLFGNKD